MGVRHGDRGPRHRAHAGDGVGSLIVVQGIGQREPGDGFGLLIGVGLSLKGDRGRKSALALRGVRGILGLLAADFRRQGLGMVPVLAGNLGRSARRSLPAPDDVFGVPIMLERSDVLGVGVLTAGAGVGSNAWGLAGSGRGLYAVVPIMLERSDVLGVGVLTAGAGVGPNAGVFAGSGRGLRALVPIVSERGQDQRGQFLGPRLIGKVFAAVGAGPVRRAARLFAGCLGAGHKGQRVLMSAAGRQDEQSQRGRKQADQRQQSAAEAACFSLHLFLPPIVKFFS